MVGGLILSQTLTLFTTPVIYLYLDRLNTRLTSWWGRAHHEEVETVAIPHRPAIESGS
jgi:hypothetical protein